MYVEKLGAQQFHEGQDCLSAKDRYLYSGNNWAASRSFYDSYFQSLLYISFRLVVDFCTGPSKLNVDP